MKKKIFKVIMFFQVLAIIGLTYYIYGRINQKPIVLLSKLDAKKLLKSSSGKLKYYYEDLPNAIVHAEGDWRPYPAVYTINTDSLNEPKDYETAKKPGVYRIITLGDSFTFGDGVSTKDNWTELLENELNANHSCHGKNKYEVINLGVRGYDTEYEVERFKRRGQKYNPDLVIWSFVDFKRFKEDIYSLTAELKMKDREYILEKDRQFYGRDSALITSYDDMVTGVANGIIAKRMSDSEVINRQNTLIDQFNSLYQGKLLYLDLRGGYDNLVMGIFKNRITKDRYMSRYKFDKPEDRLVDWHFSKIGNRKMMSNVIATLRRNKLIPCP